jgi:hypothetical protein
LANLARLLRSQMKGEELSETGVAYRFLVGPLNDVEVGAAIALDELRPVREQSDVPPDKNSVRKYSMGALDQGEGVPPERTRIKGRANYVKS